MNLCYTVPVGEESEHERKKREYAAKIALHNRTVEEAWGMCRCSTADGMFLRNMPSGCPNHPKGERRYPFYRNLQR